MTSCEVCGNHQMAWRIVESLEVQVCGLCEHVQGEDGRVAEIEEKREAEERGFQPMVYPLVKALESVSTFRVSQASAGRIGTSEFPFVFIRVADGGLKHVERLLTTLEMANQSTKRRWVVECSLQRGLLFILRPRFWKPILEIDATDIREARDDLQSLAASLARDTQLAWWQA